MPAAAEDGIHSPAQQAQGTPDPARRTADHLHFNEPADSDNFISGRSSSSRSGPNISPMGNADAPVAAVLERSLWRSTAAPGSVRGGGGGGGDEQEIWPAEGTVLADSPLGLPIPAAAEQPVGGTVLVDSPPEPPARERAAAAAAAPDAAGEGRRGPVPQATPHTHFSLVQAGAEEGPVGADGAAPEAHGATRAFPLPV